jgi:hypothetical protein
VQLGGSAQAGLVTRNCRRPPGASQHLELPSGIDHPVERLDFFLELGTSSNSVTPPIAVS